MRATWICVLLLLGACSKEGGGSNGPVGTGADGKERGACYGNGTCDVGLVCYSQLCVRPPGADCAKVGEKLASYRLGNYAPRDERAKVIGELTTKCGDAQLTAEEGRCIVDAVGRFEIAKCPRPLLEELVGDKDGCKTVGDVFTRMFVQEMVSDGAVRLKVEAFAPQIAEAIALSCVEDLWPEAGKSCVTNAGTMDAIEDCANAFPRELQRKVKDRIGPLLERIEDASRGSGGSFAPPPPPTPAPTIAPTVAPTVAPPTATATTFDEACAGYIAALQSYATCDKVPQESRDAMQQGIDAMRASMGSGPVSPEATKAMAEACAQGEKGMRDSARLMGCP